MGAYEFTVQCYRCRESEHGERNSDAARDTAIETFKARHRAKCGTGTSFSMSRMFRHDKGKLDLGLDGELGTIRTSTVIDRPIQ